jgi:methionine synthase I (cobalamin-dependent)
MKNDSSTPENLSFEMTSSGVWREKFRERMLFPDKKRFNDFRALTINTANSLKSQRFSVFVNCGIFEQMRDAMGDTVMLETMCINPEWILDFCDVMTDFMIMHYEQAIALEKGGADALCIETMSALDEACIAVKAAKDNTSCEIICTFTFEKTVNNDYRTMMGVSPEEMVTPLVSAGADIIGANCGNGMQRMIDIIRTMRKVTSVPLLVHANAGLPELRGGNTFFPETPGDMAARIPALIEAGANIIGGCCGTTPEHIRAIRMAVETYLRT